MGPRTDESRLSAGADGNLAGDPAGPRSERAGERSLVSRLGTFLRVLLVSLLVGGLALELQLRLFGVRGSTINVFKDFHRGDGRLGWTGRPGVALRFRERSFDVLVEQGADGFRRQDPEPPAEAPRRVLVLGDSLAWGWGVEQGQLFTDELQRRLGPRVAIENRAVSSYGTAQEMLLMEDLLQRKRYDAVILVFSRTDPGDNVDDMKLRPAFRFVDGRLEQFGWPPPEQLDRPLAGFMRAHSLAFRFVETQIEEARHRIDDWRGERRPDRRGAPPSETDFRRLPGYDLTRELLRAMQRIAAANGAVLVVAYQPNHVFPVGSPEAATRAARELVVDLCTSLGIPFVDVGQAFVGHRDELVIPDDGHWTAAGHRAVADALLDAPASRAAILGETPPPETTTPGGGAGARVEAPVRP
ncbi:MAG: SGNH/GDSL hydrolase family protein [Alphaproteobacteria bacterium]